MSRSSSGSHFGSLLHHADVELERAELLDEAPEECHVVLLAALVTRVRATGDRLGPYIIEDRLGTGGRAEVYRATDTRLHRTVTIKVLPERVTPRVSLPSSASPLGTAEANEKALIQIVALQAFAI